MVARTVSWRTALIGAHFFSFGNETVSWRTALIGAHFFSFGNETVSWRTALIEAHFFHSETKHKLKNRNDEKIFQKQRQRIYCSGLK